MRPTVGSGRASGSSADARRVAVVVVGADADQHDLGIEGEQPVLVLVGAAVVRQLQHVDLEPRQHPGQARLRVRLDVAGQQDPQPAVSASSTTLASLAVEPSPGPRPAGPGSGQSTCRATGPYVAVRAEAGVARHDARGA